MTPISGAFINNTFFCEFTRPLIPPQNDTAKTRHASLAADAFTDFIWAYQPRPNLNIDGSYFTWHEHNPHMGNGLPDSGPGQTHGRLEINLATGNAIAQPIEDYVKKIVHGSLMLTAWLGILPFGVFWSRYMRWTPHWILTHLSLQSTAYAFIITAFIIILVTLGGHFYLKAHPLLGVLLIILITTQITIGIVNRRNVARLLPSPSRTRTRIIHRTIGMTLILAAVAQAALGANTLFPYIEGRGREFWGVYFFLVIAWTLVFLLAEWFKWSKVVLKDTKVPHDKEAAVMPVGVGVLEGKMDAKSKGSDLEEYTWETLDKSDERGKHLKILVVGNGKYVYDASTWIRSHPGGQIILLAVAGTDISSDYFHEAGYDAQDFTPAPSIPKNQTQRTLPRSASPHPQAEDRSSVLTVDSSYKHQAQSIITNAQSIPVLTETDWARIVKARRTHVHSRLAIKRLAELVIGTVASESDAGIARSSVTLQEEAYESVPMTSPPVFHPCEYRRYALTDRQLLTTSNTANPIYKLRFALLYPYEVRRNQPEGGFLPGQCIEIQCRVEGRVLSRYYSPVWGGMVAFEVCVKMYPNGALTPFLCKQRPGERQFKVRGPFGQALVGPERPLKVKMITADDTKGVPDVVVAIAAGSGITPFIQMIEYLFLPTLVPLKVIASYTPTLPDEIALRRGEMVVVKRHYLDGWAVGINLHTGQEGVFPLPQTAPRFGMRHMVSLINCVRNTNEIIGSDVFTGALLAYPRQIDLRHVLSSSAPPTPEDSTQVPELLYRGGFQEGVVRDVVEKFGGQIDAGWWGVVCGPGGFQGTVMDTLMYRFGFNQRQLSIMTSESPSAQPHPHPTNNRSRHKVMSGDIVAVVGDYYHNPAHIKTCINTALADDEASSAHSSISTSVSYIPNAELLAALKSNTPPRAVILASLGDLTPTADARTYWLTQDLQNAIAHYVKSGGAWIVLHSGLAGFDWENSKVYLDVTKGYFTFHPDLCTVHHIPTSVGATASSPITPRAFTLPSDEHYHIKLTDADNTSVFLKTTSDLGKEGEQVAGWYHEYGQGRVIAVTVAHTEESLSDPNVVGIVRDCVRWAANLA
ncbi:hypothetical protein HK097_005385 [Rhizophlyctis rosea]|uniref:Cytochrome b5 heme-binding domain-containing protein n=1 Tax=Rhizophlyctis rosea TaxID=64517 RepID=A0AAD5SGT9_9FUNG|nr:hypothetical protein HK097_005385 [Rhizophlyctis rosea]